MNVTLLAIAGGSVGADGFCTPCFIVLVPVIFTACVKGLASASRWPVILSFLITGLITLTLWIQCYLVPAESKSYPDDPEVVMDEVALQKAFQMHLSLFVISAITMLMVFVIRSDRNRSSTQP